MGKTLVQNYVHIVFSTKHRYPFILPPVEEELHSYMGGICKHLECQPIAIGGYKDHVHILCNLSKAVPLTKLVEEIKSHSSRWIKSKGESYKSFYWQGGYGAFSVNSWQIDRVINYIRNQHEHHSKKEFKTEYIDLLNKNKITYDERYIWD